MKVISSAVASKQGTSADKESKAAPPTAVAHGQGVVVHTLQVAWHPSNLDEPRLSHNLPILSCDLSPTDPTRLATGGADNAARIWRLSIVDGQVVCTYLATLPTHEKAVNIVRFSPCGTMLATGGDDGLLLVWVLDADKTAQLQRDADCGLGDAEQQKEGWRIEYRMHLPTDAYDVAWSPSGTELIVSSTDHKATMFELLSTRNAVKKAELSQHLKYVQGVCWDPLNEFVATASNDKSVRVSTLWKRSKARSKMPTCAHVLKKWAPPEMDVTQDAESQQQQQQLGDAVEPTQKLAKKSRKLGCFLDDSAPTFFRRMQWSPDGSLLVCPTGKFFGGDADDSGSDENATLVYTRGSFPHPVLQLPCGKYTSIAVRFSAVLYALVDDVIPVFDLPYRMVFAVGCSDASVLIYDTQHLNPICRVAGTHYEPINDLAWSADGLTLTVASTDGYCTVVAFEPGALGTPLPAAEAAAIMKGIAESAYRIERKPQQQLLSAPVDATDAAGLAKRKVDPDELARAKELFFHGDGREPLLKDELVDDVDLAADTPVAAAPVRRVLSSQPVTFAIKREPASVATTPTVSSPNAGLDATSKSPQ